MRVIGHVGSRGLEPVERTVKQTVDVVLPPDPALRPRGDHLRPGREYFGEESVRAGEVRRVAQDPRVARLTPLTRTNGATAATPAREARTRRRLHVLSESCVAITFQLSKLPNRLAHHGCRLLARSLAAR